VRYGPEACPELPQQLARLARGDTAAALAFVRTYGLLGYAQVAAAVGRGAHSRRCIARRTGGRMPGTFGAKS
jgi:hypothetical protein